MSWDEIERDTEYQALPQVRKDRIRLNYFNESIAPNVPPEQLGQVRGQFFRDTTPTPAPAEGVFGQLPTEPTAQFLEGLTRGATLGITGTETGVPEPPLISKPGAARFAGEIVGGLPSGVPLLRAAAPIAGAIRSAAPRLAQIFARQIASLPPSARAAAARFGARFLTPENLTQAVAGGIYGPARLVGETRGEALREPEALGGAAATGAALGGAISAGVGAVARRFRPRIITEQEMVSQARQAQRPPIQPALPAPPRRLALPAPKPPVEGPGFTMRPVRPTYRTVFSPQLGEIRVQTEPGEALGALERRLGLGRPVPAPSRPIPTAPAAPQATPRITKRLARELTHKGALNVSVKDPTKLGILVQMARQGVLSDVQLRRFTNNLSAEYQIEAKLRPGATRTADLKMALDRLGIRLREPVPEPIPQPAVRAEVAPSAPQQPLAVVPETPARPERPLADLLLDPSPESVTAAAGIVKGPSTMDAVLSEEGGDAARAITNARTILGRTSEFLSQNLDELPPERIPFFVRSMGRDIVRLRVLTGEPADPTMINLIREAEARMATPRVPLPAAAPTAEALEAQAGRPLWQMTPEEFRQRFPEADIGLHRESIAEALRTNKPIQPSIAEAYPEVLEQERTIFETKRGRAELKAAEFSDTPISDMLRRFGLSRTKAEASNQLGDLQLANEKGLVKAKGGLGISEATELAYTEGLIPENNDTLFLNALDEELRTGKPMFGRVSPEFRAGESGAAEIPEFLKSIGRRLGLIREEAPAAAPQLPTTEQLRARVEETRKSVEGAVQQLDRLNARAKIAVEQTATIEATGTLAKEVRPEFRKGGAPVSEADLKAFKLSANEAKKGMAQIVAAAREMERLKSELAGKADALSANAASLISDSMENAVRRLNQAVEEANVQRFVANRILKSYDGPIPKDVIETMRTQGVLLNGLRDVQAKVPITTNIIESIQNWGNLTPKQRFQFTKDLVDQFRLNLFSPFSWTLDFLGNAAELTAQAVGGAGHDIVYLRHGKLSLPASQGLIHAIRSRLAARGAPILPTAEEGLGTTIGGEIIGGGFRTAQGTFTRRGNVLSSFYDYLIGTPLYAKGAIDAEAKRLGAVTYLHRAAIIAADKAGLRGAARIDAMRNFLDNPPAEAIQEAVIYGQKAGFSRPLGGSIERLANSPVTQLVLDAFPRWGFQFTQWSAEMLGYNRQLMSRLANKTATPEMVGEYMAKTATGWGGLYLIDKVLYDRVDFNSMEYVHPNGDRTRLSSREPLPTALLFLAAIHGDQNKALAALKFSSIPGAKFIGGEGGMLLSVLQQFQRAARSRDISPRRMSDEFTDVLNRAIPGQAMLGLLKTLIDPIVRRGAGAGLPGISKRLPPVIEPTTGEPLAPKIRIPGTAVEIPSVLGTPFPGATRVLNPVQKLLFRYGTPIFRGPRTSILGVPSSELPETFRDEWLVELGRQRQRILGPLAGDKKKLERLGSMEFADARALIADLDSSAAAIASSIVAKRHKLRPLISRPLSGAEQALPEAFIRKARELRAKEKRQSP